MPLADCLQESNLENELVDAALRKDFSHTSRTQRTLATNTHWHFSRQFISYLFSITLILLLTLSLIARNPQLVRFLRLLSVSLLHRPLGASDANILVLPSGAQNGREVHAYSPAAP
jgi:hypothetical protein